jgi:hypothetical protein
MNLFKAKEFLAEIYILAIFEIATLPSQLISSRIFLIFFKRSRKLFVMEFKSLYSFYNLKPE